MHGFKEDFTAWRGSLSDDERELMMTQARGEFSKKFRKTATFKQDLPEEKVAAFSQIIGKFFENEVEDYKKENKVVKTPDYDGLLKKGGSVEFDWGLKHQIIEIDRMADRRYNFARFQAREYAKDGKKYPQSSPLIERWEVLNSNAEEHDDALSVIEFMKEAKASPDCPTDVKPLIDEWAAKGVPAVGEKFELLLPGQLVVQMRFITNYMKDVVATLRTNHTEEWVQEYSEKALFPLVGNVMKWAQDNYVMARDEVQGFAEDQRKFFRSQAARKDEGLSKADILKEIWAELPKHTGNPIPPLDEEMLVELAKEPAVNEDEFMHSWGTADLLYKSEAIDSFGDKYLLGVYEDEVEATKAFTAWNAEYEKARAAMKVELAQWSKQEQSRVEKSRGPGVENIEKLLKEARR